MSQTIYPNIFDFQKDFEPESSLLGQGTFGAVYKMKSKREINSQKPGTYYAIKMMEAKSQSSF